MLALPAAAGTRPDASPAPSAVAAAAASGDYGDAPDGAPAGYTEKPRVRGAFPSRAASGGPRHPKAAPRLGHRWSAEADSPQVDRDTDEGAQLSLRSCALSTVTFAVDATGVAPGAELYVNAWFDWNRDGDWADGAAGSCGPEWAIQNVRLDPESLGPARIGTVTLRFRAGRVPAQFWWRLQVHAGAPVPHAGGGGQGTPTEGGETEDYFFDRLPQESGRLRLRCEESFFYVPHGRTTALTFGLMGSFAFKVLTVSHQLAGETEGSARAAPTSGSATGASSCAARSSTTARR